MIITIMIAFVSCKPDETCRQEEKVRCTCVIANGIDSLTVYGVGIDSLILNNAKSVTKLSLPLHPDKSLSEYVLQSGDLIDTLRIHHTPAPYFVSMACGCFVFQTIDAATVTGTIFKQTEIVNTAVQNVEEENIKLI